MPNFNLQADMQAAIQKYPGLQIVEEAGIFKLKGELELIHPVHNIPFESFSVEIYYPEAYPYCFPKVIETGGKIPRKPDRHVNTADNNTLCLTVPPEEHMLCRHGISTTRFIHGVLLPRLGEEYNVNNGGNYLHELGHNSKGFWDYYFRKLGVNDHEVVTNILQRIVDHNLPKGHENCFCGSGNKFKKCHRGFVNEFANLGARYIKSQIHFLNEHKPN